MATLSEVLQEQLRRTTKFEHALEPEKVAERMVTAVQEHARTLIAPADCWCVGMGVCDLHALVEALGAG